MIARTSRLVSWPSCSNRLSSRPGARLSAADARADDLHRDSVECFDRAEIEACRRGPTLVLVRTAHALEHSHRRRAETRARAGAPPACAGVLAIPRQSEYAGARLQVAHDALQRAAVQADRRHVLQRPAEPRRRQAEGAGLRHAQCLFGRKRAHQHVADAVMERVTARQHGHWPAAMLLDFRQHVADRTRPRDPLTLNQRVRQNEVPLAAQNQLGVGHQSARNRRGAVDSVLADADDGQPALRTATHGHAPACPDPRRHDRKPPRSPDRSPAIRASRRSSRSPAAPRIRGRSRSRRGPAASAASRA